MMKMFFQSRCQLPHTKKNKNKKCSRKIVLEKNKNIQNLPIFFSSYNINPIHDGGDVKKAPSTSVFSFNFYKRKN